MIINREALQPHIVKSSTIEISDAGPSASDMKRECNPGVRCSDFVSRRMFKTQTHLKLEMEYNNAAQLSSNPTQDNGR